MVEIQFDEGKLMELAFSSRDEANAYATLVQRFFPDFYCTITDLKLDGDWAKTLNELAFSNGMPPLKLQPTLLRDLAAAAEAKRTAKDPVEALLASVAPK
jgi:hypothetical protein